MDQLLANRTALAAMLAVLLVSTLSRAQGPDTCSWTDARTLFKTSFEKDGPVLKTPRHLVSSTTARTGEHSLLGEVAESNRAMILDIPFEAKRGEVVHLWFWVVSDNHCACTTFATVGGKRTRIGSKVDDIPVDHWKQVHAMYRPEEDVRGMLQIAAPTSYGSPVGRIWIDDITVLAAADDARWPAAPRDFPALAADRSGRLWLAAIETAPAHKSLTLYSVDKKLEREEIAEFAPPGMTGIGTPAITGLAEGCAVVVPFEVNGRWQLACLTVTGQPAKVATRTIDCGGSVNISPAITVNEGRPCLVWVSNTNGRREVYSCRLTATGHDPVERLSSPEANSYNPAIVSLPGGRMFAAWDSVRDGSADIYGAWYRDGRWQPERRITADPRIERHPSLTLWHGQIWMAWQAQSYQRIHINQVNEQRIVVARVERDRLVSPREFFHAVSTEDRMLLRPQVAFDNDGRLWVTARESTGQHGGWQPVAWRYDGTEWSERHVLMFQPGRWRPVATAVTPAGVVAACQFDEIPETGGHRGRNPDWRSGIALKRLPHIEGDPPRLKLKPLRMPETTFSLTEKMKQHAADFPRQTIAHDHGKLRLFFGNLHAHTDLSICARNLNPPGHDLFANERDIEKLDFCALTDHGFDFDNILWSYNGEQTRMNHDPDRFVTFLGQEWTSSQNPPADPSGKANRYGHHNLIHLDPHYRRYHDAFDGNISPASLWATIGNESFICIPHQLADWQHQGKGNPPTDWTYVNETLQPVAEIFQARGSYESLGCPRQARQGAPFKGYYLQDAWARGVIIGTIASPDHAGGAGKAGVWAEAFDRASIFNAIRQRHTFGTSGPKMSLFFRGGDAMMGDKRPATGEPITFEVKALAPDEIKELVIFRNNEIVHRIEPGAAECRTTWTDRQPLTDQTSWYYARIYTVDDELAWSSPIWFTVGSSGG